MPEAGLEPARYTAPHFKCGVSSIPPLGHKKDILVTNDQTADYRILRGHMWYIYSFP